MDKHGENKFFNQQEKKMKKSFNRLYSKARELILKDKDYSFHQVLDLVSESDDKPINSASEMSIKILEKFNQDEGALPGKLEEAYLDLILDKSVLQERLESGEDFHDIIKNINEELRQKKIVVNKDLLASKINQLKKHLSLD